MKNLNFITGFLAASCLFLLISATTKQTQSEEVPRYHAFAGGGNPVIYDAVTGKKKQVAWKKLWEEDNTLKQLLEN